MTSNDTKEEEPELENDLKVCALTDSPLINADDADLLLLTNPLAT